jgi:hypothetical protein
MALDGMDNYFEQDDFIVGLDPLMCSTSKAAQVGDCAGLTTDKIQFTVYPGDQELQTPRPEAAL